MITEVDLIERTLAGEKEAFGQLVLQYQKQIYRLIYHIIGNSGDTADISQEVFIKAYQNLDQLKNRCKFQGWLMRIAVNACYSWIRKKQDNLFSLEQDAIETQVTHFPPVPDEVVVKKELYKRIMLAISELPQREKTVIEMFYFEEMSYQEIQQQLGISKSVLGWRLSCARDKLRQKLQAAYHGIAFLQHIQWQRITQLAKVKIAPVSAVKFLLISTAIHLALVMTIPKIYYGKGYSQKRGNIHGIGFLATTLLSPVTQEPGQLGSYSALPKQTNQRDFRARATEPEIITRSMSTIAQIPLKSTGITLQQPHNASQLRLLPLLEVSLLDNSTPIRSQTHTKPALIFELDRIYVQRSISSQTSTINPPDSTYSLLPADESVLTIVSRSKNEASARILFASVRGQRCQPQIYIMNVDGAEVMPIADFTANPMDLLAEGKINTSSIRPGSPAVSPTGTHIAFHAQLLGEGRDIYVMDIDGSKLTRLTDGYINQSALFPAWSPDGTRIAFCLGKGSKAAIYLMNTDGNNLINLTENQAANFKPAWSPDGEKIAFSSNMGEDRRIRNIYVMDSDGKNQKQLTNNRKFRWKSWHPAWSPNGKYRL
jgi:RNA polymerase sigma factor (sigma-70 family)